MNENFNPDELSQSSAPSHLVAIGASAGGLEAIELFFQSIPKDTGMAFVVVQHLSPDFKSLMQEILVRFTEMAVERVEEGMVLRKNTVYLIPSTKQMVIQANGFHLTDRISPAAPELTISIFFESVAKVWKEKGIGIILSGSGSDGSHGLAEISEFGGLTIVQDPTEAKFDAMPRAALNTGRTILVRSASNMAEPLQLFSTDPDAAKKLDSKQLPEEAEDDLARILQLLNQHYGTDFSEYKPGTINRRIERRTSVYHQMRLTDYRKKVETDQNELSLLYKDLLVGVTHFFRDPGSFEALAVEAIPDLFEDLGDDETLRVWVPGCSTGEEVYSLAIILDEYRRRNDSTKRWKIFATDIDTQSLEFASRGNYDSVQLVEVSKSRLERYFSKTGDKYRVSRELRDGVVFATHNVLGDPPFTKVHLISCRNLLIYFTSEAQQRVIGAFLFSLIKKGVYFMGSSESLGAHQEEFGAINRAERIFTKVKERAHSTELFRVQSLSRTSHSRGTPSGEPTVQTLERLVETFVGSGVLLDGNDNVIYSLGATREFLRPAVGRASTQLTDMLDDSLKVKVSSAIHQSRRQNKKIQYLTNDDEGEQNTGSRGHIRITSSPLKSGDLEDSFVFVALDKIEAESAVPTFDDAATDDVKLDRIASGRIQELENELRISREGMQNVVEELETSNEELQSTNEELIASNEELQSTNEELQSVNEELHTVNAEFDSKNRELGEVNSDLDNLLKSTRIGVVFLDRTLKIRKFTPAAAHAIHLLDSDIMRPLSHITNNLKIESDVLLQLAEEVVQSEMPNEQEVESKNGVWYLMRLLPFRKVNGVKGSSTEGVVIAFIDIDQIKQAEAKRALESERQLVIMESVDSMVWLHLDTEGKCLEAQPAWENFLGQSWPDYSGYGWSDRFHDSDRDWVEKEIRAKIGTNSRFDISRFRVRHGPTGEFRPCKFSFWPVLAGDKHNGWVACLTDIHRSEDAQAEIEHQKRLLDSIINNSVAAISVVDNERRYVLLNRFMGEILGAPDSETLLGKTAEEAPNRQNAKLLDEHDAYVLETGRNRIFEACINPNQPSTNYHITKFPMRLKSGEIEGVVGIATIKEGGANV